MATLDTLVKIAAVLGGEQVALVRDQHDLTVTYKHDVARAVSTSTVTLWDAASDTPATFDAMTISVDPDDALTSSDTPTVYIEITTTVTASDQVTCYALTKNSPPIVIGPSTIRHTLAGSDGAITKVRAKSSTGTVKVRCLVLD